MASLTESVETNKVVEPTSSREESRKLGFTEIPEKIVLDKAETKGLKSYKTSPAVSVSAKNVKRDSMSDKKSASAESSELNLLDLLESDAESEYGVKEIDSAMALVLKHEVFKPKKHGQKKSKLSFRDLDSKSSFSIPRGKLAKPICSDLSLKKKSSLLQKLRVNHESKVNKIDQFDLIDEDIAKNQKAIVRFRILRFFTVMARLGKLIRYAQTLATKNRKKVTNAVLKAKKSLSLHSLSGSRKNLNCGETHFAGCTTVGELESDIDELEEFAFDSVSVREQKKGRGSNGADENIVESNPKLFRKLVKKYKTSPANFSFQSLGKSSNKSKERIIFDDEYPATIDDKPRNQTYFEKQIDVSAQEEIFRIVQEQKEYSLNGSVEESEAESDFITDVDEMTQYEFNTYGGEFKEREDIVGDEWNKAPLI